MRTLNPNTLERVENYITEYQKKNGKSPSYRQIMHGVGMSSLNLVQRYVLALEREGRIERTRIGNISVPPKLKPSGVAIAPLVGSIACGQPVDAVENIEESFALPRSIFGNGDLFMLRTFGDSSCLLPQADDNVMKAVLSSEEELDKRIFRFPTSAIQENKRKINYYDFMTSAKNDDCNAAIARIYPQIDMEEIKDFIYKTEGIDELQKDFYAYYIGARCDKILTPAYDIIIEQRNRLTIK